VREKREECEREARGMREAISERNERSEKRRGKWRKYLKQKCG
jgi:hypothetical protein